MYSGGKKTTFLKESLKICCPHLKNKNVLFFFIIILQSKVGCSACKLTACKLTAKYISLINI